MRVFFLFLSGLVMIGCDRPAPLGKLTRSELSQWAGDCGIAIVERSPVGERPDGPITTTENVPTPAAFEQASRRYLCRTTDARRPGVGGWSIFTDKRDRVIGFCAEHDITAAIDGAPYETVAHRASRLITAHWGSAIANNMLQDSADLDVACGREPKRLAHGMIRWGTDEPSRNYMCCWQVTD